MTAVQYLLAILVIIVSVIIVVLVATPWGRKEDNKQSRIDKINNSTGQPLFQELQLSFYERFLGKGIKAVSEKLGKFAPKRKNANKTKNLEAIRKQLRYAGSFMDPADFQFIKSARSAPNFSVFSFQFSHYIIYNVYC